MLKLTFGTFGLPLYGKMLLCQVWGLYRICYFLIALAYGRTRWPLRRSTVSNFSSALALALTQDFKISACYSLPFVSYELLLTLSDILPKVVNKAFFFLLSVGSPMAEYWFQLVLSKFTLSVEV
jgi:hypothetical protein